MGKVISRHYERPNERSDDSIFAWNRREDEPGRFWAALVVETVLGLFFIWLGLSAVGVF